MTNNLHYLAKSDATGETAICGTTGRFLYLALTRESITCEECRRIVKTLKRVGEIKNENLRVST